MGLDLDDANSFQGLNPEYFVILWSYSESVITTLQNVISWPWKLHILPLFGLWYDAAILWSLPEGDLPLSNRPEHKEYLFPFGKWRDRGSSLVD